MCYPPSLADLVVVIFSQIAPQGHENCSPNVNKRSATLEKLFLIDKAAMHAMAASRK